MDLFTFENSLSDTLQVRISQWAVPGQFHDLKIIIVIFQ